MNFKINLIIPMAGESSRFNYKFKPFIKISDKTFIEKVLTYFINYKEQLKNIYFIVNKEQYNKNNVKMMLDYILYDKKINFKIIILDKKTNSQYETLKKGIIKDNISGPSIICDCDHMVNIEPLFIFLNQNSPDLVLSLNNINENQINSWGIVIFNNNNEIINISEKMIPDKFIDCKYSGIIGCNYLHKVEDIINYEFINLTDYYNQMLILKKNINFVHIKDFLAFGTQELLDKIILDCKNAKVLFCDLDGVIIYHNVNPDYLNDENIINDTLKTLNQFKMKNKNNQIIVTTNRGKYNKIKSMLEKLNVPFDRILCNIPSGKHILINDIKPSYPFRLSAYVKNIRRNKGIKKIDIIKDINNIIIKKFRGGSFAQTFLIEHNNDVIIRKVIYKEDNYKEHYNKLKLQKYNLSRFNCYINNICPKILNEYDNDFFYFYDMEYLKDYAMIYNLSSKKKYFFLNKLFKILNEEIYIMKKINKNNNWLKNYFKENIDILSYENLSDNIKKIINMEYITINGKKLKGLKKILPNFSYLKFNPRFLSPIHGDLTYENILVNLDKDIIKLIDLDGGDYIDAIELDLGKILQSELSRYELWSSDNNIIINIDYNKHILETKEYINLEELNKISFLLKEWKNILNNEEYIYIGIFYLVIHLLRMIPFRFNVSENQAIYAIKESIYWLNYII